MLRKKPDGEFDALMDLLIAEGPRRASKRRGLENPAQHARHSGSYVDNGVEFELDPNECDSLNPSSGRFDFGFYSLVNWVAGKDFNPRRLRGIHQKGGRVRRRRLAPARLLRRLDMLSEYERLKSAHPRLNNLALRKILAARFRVSIGTVWLDLRAARRDSLP